MPKELFEEWGKKDPLSNFESYLLLEEVLNEAIIAALRETIQREIEDGLAKGFDTKPIVPDTNEEIADVYAVHENKVIHAKSNKSTEMKFINAITEGLKQSMQQHSNLVLMGQDIAEYGAKLVAISEIQIHSKWQWFQLVEWCATKDNRK